MRALLVEEARGWQAPWPEDLPLDLLEKGLRFSLPPGKLVGLPKNKEQPKEAVICEVSLVWQEQSEETELRVEVHEIRGGRFSTFGEDTKLWLVISSVVLSLALAGLVVFAVHGYPQPTGIWGFAGHYVRGAIGWSLVGLGVFLSVRIGVSPGPETFTRRYFSFLAIMLGVVGAFAWSQVSLRPEGMAGSPERDVLYLEYLRSRARTLWPLMAGVLPWVALLLEWLGSGILTKIVDALAKQAGKSEK